jgi:threonine/homoserine/homoserine lactone efflux protein
MRSGLAGGLRVALAPLLTDAPIILLAVLFVGVLPQAVVGWVGVVGGVVVVGMGVEILRTAPRTVLPGEGDDQPDPRRELWRGVLVNLLNPHPYLFWTTVGAPALVGGWRISPWHALAFVGPFYALLVGSKVALAWAVSRRAGALPLKWYRGLLAGCGVLMVVLGCWLVWQTLWSR